MTELIKLETAQGQVPDYMRRATEFMHDPQATQRVAIEHVEAILGGSVSVTDATNPFVTLMGVSAANTSAAVLANGASLRRRYEQLATTEAELYHHMSDVDYVGRFANPHTQKVLCLIAMGELKAKMVPQSDGTRRVVIPRFSRVTVDDITYTLMYPVVIREYASNSLSVHYDLATPHPLLTMASSLVYWTEREVSGADTKFLQLELDMVQVRASTVTYDLNPAQGLDKRIALVDSYCSAQVYFKGQSMSNWQPIKTTHSDMVYNANEVTAVLAVVGAELRVRIPQIYFTSGMISGKLRVIVYTTKGEIFLNATGKSLDNFQSNWAAEDGDPISSEVAAWQAVTNKFLFFQGVSSGGAPAMSFETLRANVINGATVQDLPITPSQLNTALSRNGYTIRKFVDTVTGRQLLASKPLPAARDGDLITPASATIASVLTTMSALKSSPWVADNGQRVTIVPNALWQLRAGVVRMVSQQELLDLNAQDAETRAGMINASSYLYSPYYYVLDASLDRFAVRPYHLDEPTIMVDKFIGENETTGMQVEIAQLQIINTGNGWQIQVTTLSNTAWKEQDVSYRYAQLSFTPPGVGASAAVNGERMEGENGEDLFIFHLPSGYDIDANHKVSHLGFHAITSEPREVYSDLKQSFRLTFATASPLPAEARPHAMDNELVTADLPNRIASVGAQQVQVVFGHHLKNLWAACRTIAPVQPWKTYPANVPALEPLDVYETNAANGTTVFFDAEGKPFFKKLRSAGDPILTSTGDPVFEHMAGDIVYAGGEAVPVGDDMLQRQLDMLFLEGCYFFATDASTTQYTQEVIQVLTNYITKDLPTFENKVVEITNIFFYPRVTLGSVTAVIDAGVVAQIQADQSLTVRLGVADRVADNVALVAQLEKKTIQVIQEFFGREVLTTSDLTAELQRVYAGDVISISVTGLGGGNNASAITLTNANERCSVKKRVFILNNGEFTVREDISVDIFKHVSN